MKQIILLALVIGCFVVQLQATDIFLVYFYKDGNANNMNITFKGETIADMKEAFKAKTGLKIEDQRLVNDMTPIIDQKLVSELKIEPRHGKPMVVLTIPLRTDGHVYVWKNNKEWKIPASGKETLGEFRKKIRPGKLFFGRFELKDDSKTLDYYQIGMGNFLEIE